MTRRKPPSRLGTEAHKITIGALKCYLHVDRQPCGPVEHIVITPSGKTGSDFQRLCVELSRLINIELQELPAPSPAVGPDHGPAASSREVCSPPTSRPPLRGVDQRPGHFGVTE